MRGCLFQDVTEKDAAFRVVNVPLWVSQVTGSLNVGSHVFSFSLSERPGMARRQNNWGAMPPRGENTGNPKNRKGRYPGRTITLPSRILLPNHRNVRGKKVTAQFSPPSVRDTRPQKVPRQNDTPTRFAYTHALCPIVNHSVTDPIVTETTTKPRHFETPFPKDSR